MENTEPTTPFQAPSLEELAPLFPAYDIEAFIAQGGMGAVYQAKQISLDRAVAIKILPREFGADPEFRESFEAEAKAMARLNHPNLIGIYDFGDIDGMLFLIMELVHGKSLYHSCYGKAIDPVQASEIIIAVCEGIDHAHDADILHRDIKPANILLSMDATPKIGDFGLAAPMNAAANPEDVIYGTPGYTAPEVIARQPVDRRADIFSIGVMLHEMLTGQMPDEHRTRPSSISGCPMGYDTIVARSTHPDPNQRYNTAAELAEALKKVSSQPASVLNVPAAPVRSAVTMAAPQKKSPALALTLIALVAIAGIAVLANRKDKDPAPATTDIDKPATPVLPSTPTPGSDTSEPVEATSTVNTAPTPSKKTLPPIKQLALLKARLASGARDQFPDTTVERNGSHFLLLKTNFTRPNAEKLAEEHGAHLAILADTDDRKWLMQQFSITRPTWIGAGLAANDSWQWTDSSPWNSADTPGQATVGEGFLALNSHGELIPQPESGRRPIILQWRNDGSNPCTMEEQLKRTTASIEDNGLQEARYPVGTRTLGESHFLRINQKVSWDSARELTTKYKGHLPVPSSPEENQWLAKTFASESKTHRFWLGGFLLTPTSPWQWITQEAWHSTGWASGQPSDDSAKNRMIMTLRPGGSAEAWSSSDGKSGEANCLMIEWSEPKKAATAKIGDFDLDQWLAGVNSKIQKRVKPDVEEYQQERGQIINGYIRAMKRAARRVEVPGGRRGGRGNDRLTEMVENSMEEVEESGELLTTLPRLAPDSFQEIQTESTAELKKLDDIYQAKLKAHLDFYTKGLLGKATSLTEEGFTQQARELQEKVAAIGEDTSLMLKALDLD
ncbi:protein kinase [Verrucomicrobiaceae bacterium R5-34]|nr:protein kinase [Verrucomicrobiaceae bacterium R5-34]